MRKSIKRLVSCLLAGACVATVLTGCSGSGEIKDQYTVEEASSIEVMKVGDETVTLDEVYLYVIQCMYTFNLDSETAKESEATYKSTILEQIQDGKAKYQVALTADLEMTEEDEALIDETVDKYYETFGQEIFDAYGISREAIRQLFVEQKYITKLQDKAMNDLVADYLTEGQEEYGDKTFVDVDYVLFSKSKLDADGNSVDMTESEIAATRAEAAELQSRAAAGEDLKTLAEEYGIEDSYDTQKTFIGAYTGDLNDMLSSMKDGEISEVYEDDGSFMIMQMVNSNDTEYRDYFVESYASQKAEETYTSMEQVWLAAMNISDDDIIGDTWEKLSIVDIAEYLYDNNIGIGS